MSSEVLDLLCDLIKIKSISPNDNGCQTIVRDFLKN